MARGRRRKGIPTEDEAEPGVGYEEASGGGATPGGVGGRRNVAAGAQEFEGEDYDEQNRRNVAGEGGGGVQTGNYEEDYGPGTRGFRHPEFHTEPAADAQQGVLRRSTRTGATTEDFPSGAWSERRLSPKVARVESRKARARAAAGRGVGVQRSTKPPGTRSGGRATPRAKRRVRQRDQGRSRKG